MIIDYFDATNNFVKFNNLKNKKIKFCHLENEYFTT